MKKPYFKFDVDAYLSGEIMFCSPAAQGLFIMSCALYWKNDRELPIAKVSKRLANAPISLDDCLAELQEAGVINVIDSHISIKFLDDLYLEMCERSKINAESGRKGGLAERKKRQANA